MPTIKGPFDVKLSPLDPWNSDADAMLGRRSIDKRFHGPLDATSRGEMLSAGTPTDGSAAYSAIERVTGTLDGRQGSFTLQHTGVMNRGTPSLVITVVPDSGSGELAGIRGTMEIIITQGKHSYVFDYELPGPA